jgi:hypothetical protein
MTHDLWTNDKSLDDITRDVIHDVMSDENEFTKLVAEATEKMKREAYARGWRDAIAALQKASEGAIEVGQGEAETAFTLDLSGSKNGEGPSNLTVGSTPHYTFQAIKKRPGMTGSEVVTAVQEGGHNVSEGNIRTSIARLKGKRLIVARHNKWFPL